MSLVDALQVSPARSRRVKIGGTSLSFPTPKMNGGVRVEVTLLDGHKLEFSVGTRLLTQELIALVASHFALRESQYFSLAYKDNTGHYHWLVEDWRLLDHDFARGVRVLPLHFLVRFFPESITELRDVQAVEMFYQQARNLVAKSQLEVDSWTVFNLAAYAVQASCGDFLDESTTKSHLKKLHLLPLSTVEEHPSLSFCEDNVCEQHKGLSGLSRGDAILSYMREVESVSGYGVHFYEVRDRANLPWYLGISQKGIAQYDYLDKRKPRKIFLWKQLENLYLRERKFSIEVHDPKRIVHTLNSFNLYEGAIEDQSLHQDELLKAISEDTTQVSVSRRTFGPGNVSVYVWFAETPSLCKAIWSMAIAQHQFCLDRKIPKSKEGSVNRDPLDLAGELSRSCLSLSTHSSPNLSRSGSHSSLQQNSHTESLSTESLHAARMEMLSALQQRYDTIQEKLSEKTEELKLLCLREGELTGELPPEYPIKPGEPPPTVRKRVGTSFVLDENLISKIINKQEETVSSLELEREIQAKIASAALRLANESSSRKGLRKQRKLYYHQAFQRLKDIELKLTAAKTRQAQILSNNASTIPKMKKKPRPVSDGDGIQDDSYISLGISSFSSQDCHKETSFIDGIALSPPGGGIYSQVSPRSNLPSSPLKPKISTLLLHSAPPSPQRASSLAPTANSESSSQPTISEDSRSSSPGRPSSGYIPSCVYTLSQYRAQHYPTLSTRGHSVPNDGGVPCQRPFTGEISNLPQQRNSLASHSLDDLDTSVPNSPHLHSLKSPSHHLPPQHSVASQGSPHQYHFHHHHYNHHHHTRRLKTDSNDRYGSLDRRRASSGRLESRSLEHLDAVPPNNTPSSRYSNTPAHNNHTPPTPQTHHPPPQPLEYSFPYEPREGQVYPSSACIANHSFESSICDFPSLDTVDSGIMDYGSKTHNANRGDSHISSEKFANCVSTDSEVPTGGTSLPTKLSRSTSARGCIDNGVFSPHFSYNQENIPPALGEGAIHRATTPYHRHGLKGENQTSLRPTASVHVADNVRPFRIPATDLPPLRATKSSIELPPLKPTNGRLESQLLNSNEPNPRTIFQTPRLTQNHSFSAVTNSTPNSSRFSNGIPNSSSLLEEPLISLAEAALIKKHQADSSSRGRGEWMEPSQTQPTLDKDGNIYKERPPDPKPPAAAHNLSTSSIGSSGSSSSVFHSTNEGSDSLNSSLNATLTIESPCNHMVITTGTFQPSREVSKPFEMSDFYKYSTKFRRQSSGQGIGGSSDVSSGSESPLSPASLKRPPPQNLSSSNKSISNSKVFAPPSPSIVARHSCPAPQQKGIYQPLTPLTCHAVDEGSGDVPEAHLSSSSSSQDGSWENSPLHQAVPINVTAKRSATLV